MDYSIVKLGLLAAILASALAIFGQSSGKAVKPVTPATFGQSSSHAVKPVTPATDTTRPKQRYIPFIAPFMALEIVAGANANLFVMDAGSINRNLITSDQSTVLVSNLNMLNTGIGFSAGFEVNLCLIKAGYKYRGLRRKINNSAGISLGMFAYNNGLYTEYADASGKIRASEDIRITGLAFPVKLKYRKAYIGVQYNNNLFCNKFQSAGHENSQLMDLKRDLPDHLSAMMGLRFSIFDLNIEYSPAFVFPEAASYLIIDDNGYFISLKASLSIPVKI